MRHRPHLLTLHLAFAALVLVVGCKKSPSIDVPEAPSLEGSSTEPILLRYTFIPGDQYDWTMDMNVEMNIEAGGQEVDMTITSDMSGDYSIASVDGRGWANAVVTFARVTFDMDIPDTSMHFDSDDPATNSPELAMLSALVEEPLTMMISPRGEIDEEYMVDLMDRFGGGFGASGGMHDQLLNSSFIGFPEEPVSVGDTYDAGSITMPSAQGEVEVGARYEVLSISGDGSQVLLKPHIDMAAAFDAVPGFEVESFNSDGWMLFDAVQGVFTRYTMGVEMAFSITAEGESGGGEMAMVFNYEIANFERGTGTAERPAEAPTPNEPPTGAPAQPQ